MSMLSGLTSTDDDSFGLEDYEELSEDCSNRSSIAQRIDISKDTFCTLVQALNTLDNNTKIKVLESLANVDSSVRDVIGYDTNEYLSRLENKYDAIQEGFWQDLIRWGLVGAIVGKYLSSFGRIRKCCKEAIADGISQDKLKSIFARSIYLPDAKIFFDATKGLAIIHDILIKASKNLDSFEPKQTFNALKNTGFEVTEKEINGVSHFDFKAVAGSILGKVFFLGLSVISGSLGTPLGAASIAIGQTFGNTAYSHAFSKNGWILGERGWNPSNMMQAAKQMIQLVDWGEDMKNIKTKVSEATAKAKKDYEYKIKFLNKLASVYCEDVKELGRGLASAIYHVKK